MANSKPPKPKKPPVHCSWCGATKNVGFLNEVFPYCLSCIAKFAFRGKRR